MEITEQEYNDLKNKVTEQRLEIDRLKGKDEDEQVSAYLQHRKELDKERASKLQAIKQSFV